MPDVPFGFSTGDDPDRDRDKGDPDPASNPFGFGGGDFNPGDLGQLFSQLGQMFSGAGTAMSGGAGSGPVNYDLARKLASSSIGFTAPIAEATSGAVADAVHLADTWLDGACALPAGVTKAVAWTPQDWVDGTMD
ncbi:MAG: zinc-dependent metalloprotease, partial [Mycobacterium sp.]|nr:zinc-dependent metalloprotease [Mycobacterium sp.]